MSDATTTHGAEAALDTGTAYGLKLGSPLNELALIGPGTPYGR